MTLVYSMGRGHDGKPPAVESVLDTLALDANGVGNANGDFAEWCAEYGYDTDSRQAEHTFKVCQRQAKKLRAFLGSAHAYATLLFETESV
jgi:hypothetical protein